MQLTAAAAAAVAAAAVDGVQVKSELVGPTLFGRGVPTPDGRGLLTVQPIAAAPAQMGLVTPHVGTHVGSRGTPSPAHVRQHAGGGLPQPGAAASVEASGKVRDDGREATGQVPCAQ